MAYWKAKRDSLSRWSILLTVIVALLAATLACSSAGAGDTDGEAPGPTLAEATRPEEEVAEEEPAEEAPAEEELAEEEEDGSAPTANNLKSSVAIVNRAGEVLGNGEVRLSVTDEISVFDEAIVELEIIVSDDSLLGAVTPTPIIGTPRPTPSPLPLLEAQFVEVRELMGAGIRGPDIDHFIVDPEPFWTVQVRPIEGEPGQAAASWMWYLIPGDESIAGLNELEVYVFLPNVLDDDTPYREETNIFRFTINVLPPPTRRPTNTPPPTRTPTITSTPTITPTPTLTPTPTSTPVPGFSGIVTNALDTWGERLVTLGTLASLAYGLWRFVLSRRAREERAEDRRNRDLDE